MCAQPGFGEICRHCVAEQQRMVAAAEEARRPIEVGLEPEDMGAAAVSGAAPWLGRGAGLAASGA
jgi:hypothetical protein